MSRHLLEEWNEARHALDASFHVRSIATFLPDMVTTTVNENHAAWLKKQPVDIDQFPIMNGERAVGVLKRPSKDRPRAAPVVVPLVDAPLVAADLPITRLIPLLRDRHYRLVVRDDRIDGIVTQSDLLKLPMRIVMFAAITHLERVMGEAIVQSAPDGSWRHQLNDRRRQKLSDKETKFRDDGINPPTIELTDFCDKREIIGKRLPQRERRDFERSLKRLEQLRNALAHASSPTLAKNGESPVRALVDAFADCTLWIDTLSREFR